jgi:hypothetical protein
MAARQNGPFGNIIDGLSRLAERTLGPRVASLLGSTSLSTPPSNPFGDFGAIVAAGSKPIGLGQSVKDVALFTVEEARERIASFMDGSFVPDSLNDLIQYLADRFLRIESRTGPAGEVANYLVDERTKRSVPAAQVDPRLGHKAMLVADLRQAVRPYLSHSAPADAFHSWEGMSLVLDNDASGIGYAAVGGQAFIGKVHAVASAEPAENQRMVADAKSKGLRLILPERTPGSGAAGNLVAGMPVLVASRSVRAEEVHSGLAHSELARAWGGGLADTLAKMGERARAQVGLGGPNVVSIESFRKSKSEFRDRFVRRSAPAQQLPEPEALDDASFGGGGSKRDLSIRVSHAGDDGRPSLVVFDRDLGIEVPIAVRALPPGRYDRETGAGDLLGMTEIGRGGAARHFDREGNAIRPAAPAPAAAEDSDAGPRMARRP